LVKADALARSGSVGLLASIGIGLVFACSSVKPESRTSAEPPPASGNASASEIKCDPAAPVELTAAREIVTKRCVSCHSPNGTAGDDYDWTKDSALIAHRRNVAAQVSEGSMPPPGYPKPTPEEARTLVCWALQKS